LHRAAQQPVKVAAFAHADLAPPPSPSAACWIRFLMDYAQSLLKECRATDLIKAGIEVRTRHRRHASAVHPQAVWLAHPAGNQDPFDRLREIVFRNRRHDSGPAVSDPRGGDASIVGSNAGANPVS
jgi:hypothetical protein